MTLIRAIIPAVLVLISTPNWACHKISLSIMNPLVPLSGNPTPRLPIQVERDKQPEACSYFITVDRGTSTSYARSLAQSSLRTPYQITDDSQTWVLKAIPDITNTHDVIVGSFNAAAGIQDQTLYYRAILEPLDPTLSPGLYSDTVTIAVYENTWSSPGQRHDAQTVTLTASVSPTVQLSLVSTGAPFNANSTSQSIDFGIIRAGTTRAIDSIVLANSGFDVFFSSANEGRLKHTETNATVPYSIRIGNVAVSLAGSSSTPIVVASSNSKTPLAGQRYPIEIKMESPGTAPAGAYRDSITVTVSSRL